MCVVAFAGLLWLTRGYDFYFDEWDFVLGAPHWTLGDYFQPHNEHWSTVPMLIYKALLSTAGARSYTPFMAVLLAIHAAIGFLLFVFVRRRQGAALGLVAAAFLLFLGRGSENILWAFQIGFLGSIATGLAAWLLVDDPARSAFRPPAAALLLLLSVMSSGVGPFFVGAVGVELLLDRRRRPWLWTLAPAVLAYGAWFLLIGRRYSTVHRSPYSLEALRSLVTYVPFGIGAAVVGLFGLALKYSEYGLAALAGLLVASWAPPRPRPSARAVACLAGLVAEFALIGLVRAQFGDQEAGSARYVYIAAVFLLPLFAEALGGLPWRGAWPAALAAVAALTVVWSGYHLVTASRDKDALFARQKAELETVWAFRDAPGLNGQAVIEPDTMPQVSVQRYLDGRRTVGSPLPEVPFSALSRLPPGAVDRELAQVLRFGVAGSSAPPPQTGCVGADPVLGYMDQSARDGQSVQVSAQFPGHARFYAWAFGPAPPDRPIAESDIPPGERVRIVLPVTGHDLGWHVRTYPPPYGEATACAPA